MISLVCAVAELFTIPGFVVTKATFFLAVLTLSYLNGAMGYFYLLRSTSSGHPSRKRMIFDACGTLVAGASVIATMAILKVDSAWCIPTEVFSPVHDSRGGSDDSVVHAFSSDGDFAPTYYIAQSESLYIRTSSVDGKISSQYLVARAYPTNGAVNWVKYSTLEVQFGVDTVDNSFRTVMHAVNCEPTLS